MKYHKWLDKQILLLLLFSGFLSKNRRPQEKFH